MARTVVNVTSSATLDGRDISADGTKLDGIEANATADQNAAEIKSLVEASSDIALAGNPTTTTQSSGNSSTRIATTAFVADATSGLATDSNLNSKAPIASPTFTGVPAAPTASSGTNTTQIATTAFVTTAVAGATIDGISSSADATAITIDSSENVGIGTSSPASLLELEGADPIITLDDTSAGGYAQVQALNGSLILMADEGGSVSNSIVRFDVDGTERMRIDSSGKVGIGRTPTDVGLEVAGPSYTGFDGPASVFLYGDANYNAAGDAGSGILFGGEYTSAGSLTTFALISGIKENTNNTDYAGALTFQTRANGSTPVERMRIDSAGNVGIGTTSPASTFNNQFVVSTVNSSGYANITAEGATGSGGGIDLWGGSIRQAGTYSLPGSHLAFYTNGSNSGTALSERMRIDSSGNLLVGKTATNFSDDGFELRGGGDGRLYVTNTNDTCVVWRRDGSNGTIQSFYRANNAVGNISVTTTATTYNTSSDERLKENIVDAPAGNIDDIRVRSFDWKADGTHQTYGMVAQELVEVAPEAVTEGQTDDNMWQIDYSKLVPMMIKEIQDLKAEVAALKGA